MGKFSTGNIIAIKDCAGKYLSAQPKGSIVETTDLKESEQFTVRKVEKKTVVFTSMSDSDIIVDTHGLVMLHKKGFHMPRLVAQYENAFVVIKVDHNLYGFRAANGRFLIPLASGRLGLSKMLTKHALFSVQVLSTAVKISKTNRLKVGKAYHIKSAYKLYLSTEGTGGILRTLPKVPTESEVFVVEQFGSQIQLKAFNKDEYIVFKDDGSVVLDAKPTDGFNVLLSHGKVILESAGNGRLLSAKRDGTIGQETTIRTGEEFETIKYNWRKNKI
jgi:hypothetical protein